MKIDTLFTSATLNDTDHINSISWARNGQLPYAAVAKTVITYTACDDRAGNVKLWIRNMDIIIDSTNVYHINADRPGGINDCPPNEYDFRSVIEHEFGHAIGLLHTLNKGDIMNPEYGPQDMLTLSANDIDAANYEVYRGTFPLSITCTNTPMSVSSHSCPYAGIDISQKLTNMFTVFPNPFTDKININFDNNSNSDQSITILVEDVQGSIIYTYQMRDLNENQDLDLSYLPAGIYIIKYISRNNLYTQKISKL